MKLLLWKIIKMIISNFTIKDKVFFLKELAYLLKWWLVMPVALDTIKNNTEKETIQKICSTIWEMINKWETLSRSMSILGAYFNEWDIKIISAWENIWELPKLLKQLASEYENLYKIRTKYLTAMLYPSILLLIIIWAIIIIFKFILPWFIEIVNGFGNVEIPFTTKILININEFLKTSWMSFTFLIITLFIILWLFLSTIEGKRILLSILIKLPLIGKIYKLYYVVVFLRYFSLLIYSWLPITKVFIHLKWTLNNPYYKDMCDEIIENLNQWQSFVPVLKKYDKIIPSDIVVLLKVWEESATLQDASSNAISLYEEEFDKIIDNLSKVIEPILIIFVWLIVGFIAIAIFSVITSVLNSVQI